jgi:hypothetical protein
VAEVSDEDLERLANRMAMLVSEGGEADNAGRAVSALARRLGLTGGEIKAFFLAGAADAMRARPRQNADAAQHLDRLERELSAMRHGLKLTEVQARNAQRERDALRVENGVLLDLLDRTRSAKQVRKFVGGAAVAASILGAAVLYVGPGLRPPVEPRSARPAGSPFLRSAVVRPSGVTMLQAPEEGSGIVTQLPGGTRVQVRQVLWRGQMQWSEIEVGGLSGFVQSITIDLS